jgi:hypothetical protein
MAIKIGDVVLVREVKSGYITNEPAIVTRVWGEDCINVQVLPDCATPYTKTSVQRFQKHPSDVGATFIER